MADRRTMLGAVHIAAKDLALPRDQYEAAVMGISAGRATSSKDLTDAELGRLLDRFRDLGWTPTATRKRSAPRRPPEDQVAMIRRLWDELGRTGELRDPSPAGLRKWINGQVGRDDVTFCDSRQKARLIEALKSWLARVKASDRA